jgi:cell division protein FtsQ
MRPVIRPPAVPPAQPPAPGRRSPATSARSPGPSKLAYRLSRIWKKAWVRRAALLVPVLCLGLIAGRVATSPAVADWASERRQALVAALSSRPEFAVRGYRVAGAARPLERAVDALVDLPPGASSLTIDVAALQARIAELGAVRSVRVKLDPDGILRIGVDERIAEALWRASADGGEAALYLVGRDGVAIGPAGRRAQHPDLPVIIGDGAPSAMAEALALVRAVPDLRPRLRALVRVGQRRWNVVLDRGLTIMLPEQRPEPALARVMALHYGEELLDRDLAVIDMRLGDRPTLRMTPRALDVLRLRDAAGDDPGRRT